MKKITLNITILFVLFVSNAKAQYTFQHLYQEPLSQCIGNFIELKNADIIFSICNENKISKLIKINPLGEIIDSLPIDSFKNTFYKIIQYDTNSFFITGTAYKGINEEFIIRRYDFNFNLLYEIFIPVEGNIKQLNDVGYLINNKNNLIVTVNSSTQPNCWINFFEIDNKCQLLKSEKYYNNDIYSSARGIIQKDDFYYFFIYDSFMYQGIQALKYDSNFTYIGNSFNGENILEDNINVNKFDNNVFLLSGRNYSGQPTNYYESKVLKIKIENNFQILKSFKLFKNDSAIEVAINESLSFIDTNNIFLGSWSSKTIINDTLNNFILTKLDANLNQKWTKKYGGDAFYTLISIKATRDGGCIMGANRYDYYDQINGYDVFIMKVNSEGNLAWVHNLPSSFMKVNVYPNPGSDKLIVNNPPENTSLVLYNTQGQTVITQSLNQSNCINTSSLQSGVYFYRLIDGKGKILGAGKWVKTGE